MVREMEFDLSSLSDLDNGVGAQMVRRQIERIVEDIQKRPGDKSRRKLTVTVEFLPKTIMRSSHIPGETSLHLTGVAVRLKAKTSIPDQQTADYDMGLVGNKLVFNPDSPYDHRQASLFPGEDDQVIAGRVADAHG